MRGLRYQVGDVVHYNDSTLSAFGNPTRVEQSRHTTRGSLQQTVSTEAATEAAQTVTLYQLFLPPDEVIDAGDEWQAGGLRWVVDGAPFYATGSRGVHHIECQVRLVAAVT